MPGRKVATPLKAKNDSKPAKRTPAKQTPAKQTPAKRTPAKRPIDNDDQTPTPKRRRCLFTNPNNQPECYEDPSKIGSLAGLFLNREKIRLPGKTHLIQLVDHRMQIHDPLCTPVFPAKVPIDTIVNDFLIFKKLIRANKKATQEQMVQHAWGLSEMVRIFNEYTRSHILLAPEFKDFDKKRAKKVSPSQTYGVIHLMRMISKLHEMLLPLSIYEDIKEEVPEFMKFIDSNYKKYWSREAEYPTTDKHSFERKTGIRWLE
ncbi:unnamed protein product [Caenorhabditis nigoni]